MFGSRAFYVAFQNQAHHRLYLAADEVGCHANDAVAARAHYGECLVVVAAPHLKVVVGVADYLRNLHRVAAGFFRTDNVVDVAEAHGGLVGHIQGGAARHIV